MSEYVDKKAAAFDPKKLFAQALQGAMTGAIVGSRRSLDEATLQGAAQGAAIGALGGVLGGQVQGRAIPGSRGTAGSVAGGALAGYLASRGPRGESRPDLHLRLDRGTGKLASELRDMMKAKRRANLDAHAKRMQARGGHWSQIATTKEASNVGHAVELAGLGILAAPSVAEMRGKKISDKTKHRAELAGLGVLAAPSAVHLGGKAVSKIKGLAKGIAKRAETVNGDYETVDSERAQIASTPLGERALADSDGANQHPRVARAFLRRLAQRMGTRPMIYMGRRHAKTQKSHRRDGN